MKGFLIIFTGIFTLHYFFGTDRDIAGMVFVSAFVALIWALVEKRSTKYGMIVVKKILESFNRSRNTPPQK